MGNTIIKGFVNSRRTHFIYQPAIGSFYEGGQYSFKEVLSARDPWSGWIHYDAGLDVLQALQLVREDRLGKQGQHRRDLAGGASSRATPARPARTRSSGRNGTPSYLTLAAPDKRNFSTVFMNDSDGVAALQAPDGQHGLYWQAVPGALGNPRGRCGNGLQQQLPEVPLHPVRRRQRRLHHHGQALLGRDRYDAGQLCGNAEYDVPLPVEGARTVLDTDATGAVQNTTDKILYADNFDYSGKTVPVIGAGGQDHGKRKLHHLPRRPAERDPALHLRPQRRVRGLSAERLAATMSYANRWTKSAMGLGGTWNNGNPITGIGDNRWLNYKASVDVSFENNSTQSGNNYAAIGARQQGGGSSHYINGTPYVLKFLFDGSWQLLVDGTAVASGNVVSGSGGVTIAGFKAAYDAWHNLALQVVDKKVTAYLDGTHARRPTPTRARDCRAASTWPAATTTLASTT